MNIEINFLETLKSSYTLVMLLFCSLILLAFTLERWLYFRRTGAARPGMLDPVLKLLDNQEFDVALAQCRKEHGPLARLAHEAIANRHRPRNLLQELLDAHRLEQKMALERYLGILGTLGNTAPFIGLFGTVMGIIKAFRDLARSGSGGPSVVAAGISEALVATAAGLAVAIPAVIFYNYYLRRLKNISSSLEAAQIRLLVHLQVNKGP